MSTDREGALLRADGVTKRFPGVLALDDMHLDVQPGEVLALVGENGAGKSTLMKLLAGIHRPDAGEFFFAGKPLQIRGPRDAMDQGLVIIHQELNLVPDLTVAENIWIGREPRTAGIFTSRKSLQARTRELLDRVELPLDPAARVGSLTVAMQQMVEIAKALSFRARLLILDEPTAALNDAEVASLHGLIRRFITPETGAIYISHRMDELKQISNRITVIRDGQYVKTVPTADTSMDEVIRLMVGREVDVSARPVNVRTDRRQLLSVRNLSTRAKLRDVSFDLHEGEILGVAGLMGAGRTEVGRAIVGADRRSSGTIHLNGQEVPLRSPTEAARRGIGYLSEDRKQLGLLLDHSVNTNIGLGALAERFSTGGWVRDAAMRTAAREQVQDLRIRTPTIDQAVRNLSGGNQQKVVLARWLVVDCDLLIIDEPTRGIDVGAKEEIYNLLNSLAEQGKSIIMISSELPEVLRMSHRVLVMSEGRVTGILTADQANQESIMSLATLRPASSPPDREATA